MRRIGILGGTFDPPHNAHITMAATALEELALETVLFMPAPDPPHKQGEPLTPYELRRRMTQLAIDGHRGMELSLMEEFRAGPSFTVDLLKNYKQKHPDGDVYLILGADSVEELNTWKNPQELLTMATLVVFPRTGYSSRVPVEGEASVVLFEEPVSDVSSTEIRESYTTGDPARDLVPKAVHEFILDNSLYS